MESARPRAAASARAATGALKGRVSIAVIGRPLLGIVENLVRLGDFFEHLFGLLVSGILVRMVLDRLLPVSFLELLFGGVPRDSEQFVAIFLGHASGRRSGLFRPRGADAA